MAGANAVTTAFGETEPISTYLFAFAAGPFVKVNDRAGLPGLYVRKSKLKQAQSRLPSCSRSHPTVVPIYQNILHNPFRFRNTIWFLFRVSPLAAWNMPVQRFSVKNRYYFRTVPTETDLINRDITVLHELTLQWFGDFTTMRWFDDLWLKEGFAQYMAYKALATLRPNENIDKRFIRQSSRMLIVSTRHRAQPPSTRASRI